MDKQCLFIQDIIMHTFGRSTRQCLNKESFSTDVFKLQFE